MNIAKPTTLAFRYCPRCGAPLAEGVRFGRPRPFCRYCGFIHFLDPKVAVGALVSDGQRVLLVRRSVPPRAGYWALPAGYMDGDELPEEALLREVAEETGLQVVISGLQEVAPLAGWNEQRGLLLLVVAAAIPFGYSGRSFRTHRVTLVLIAIVGALFAIVNAVALPSQLTDPVRFVGYAKTAPALTVILGGLLPFVFWGLWNVKSTMLRMILGLGFLSGMAALVLSAQRAGTVAGIVGLIPLTLATIRRKKNVAWLVLLGIVLALLGFFVVQYTSEEKIGFLLSRYRLDSGLSDRDLIWAMALSEIARDPLLGQGIGAAEWVISSSFHNAYLEVWFNAGFLGLVLFLAAQAYFFLRIRYLNRILADPEAKSILALALGYMMGFVVLCIFESVGAGASNLNVILYLYLGVLVSGGALFEAVSPPLSAGSFMPSAHPEPAIVSDHRIALSS